jgi:Spy/CpxP family protein refolding chaperone
MTMLKPLIATVLFAASTALFAQTPPAGAADGAKGPQKGRRFDCSQAKDPKACEEMRQRMKAAYSKAKSACEGKQGAEHRDCMRDQMCAQSKDPAKCKAQAQQRSEAFRKAREACKDKQGDEMRSCMRAQMGKGRDQGRMGKDQDKK